MPIHEWQTLLGNHPDWWIVPVAAVFAVGAAVSFLMAVIGSLEE